MNLTDLHLAQSATLAADGIPLHYGDLRGEYSAGLESAVLMDRSHEGRLQASGRDRLELIHRISTNDLTSMASGEGRSTIFTNANARILDRAFVYHRDEKALLITEPGRGTALMNYLQRNVFFNDDFRLDNLSQSTRLFALHGPQADSVMASLWPDVVTIQPYFSVELTIDSIPVFAARRKPLSGSHWVIIVPPERAGSFWSSLLEAGREHGLLPAGSLTYNTLRIRAGHPALGRELSLDYIPLEVGLWDEVSFSKGCYTGQEIIARMESRNRLAKVMVKLALSGSVASPADLYRDEHKTGTLTSSVTAPDGKHLGLGFVRTGDALAGLTVHAGDERVPAAITGFAGAPAPQFAPEFKAQENS
jgi:folate-binding protein YgfZ